MTEEQVSLLNDSSDLLINQRSIHREMASLGTAAHKEFDIDSKHISALKDYVHYYKNDWAEGNPLVPEKDVKWRCRLVPAFRRLFKVVEDLRQTGSLSLLKPILDALDREGIHITIDDNVKFEKHDELMKYINAMNDYQTQICELADERSSNREDAVAVKNATNKSFNEYVRLMANYKSSKDKSKTTDSINEDLQNLFADNLIDQSVYTRLRDDVND